MEREKAYDVYVTTDYSIFKRLVGNRDIPENRINKIAGSILNIGWIKNPIVVNEKMEVIDGQGRLTALQRLGLPVEYIIAEGTGSQECIYMNMNMVNWSQPDFVKSYAEQGNKNYQKLLSLMQRYVNGNLNIICTALYRTSKAKHKEIKQGSIIITDEQYFAAEERLKYVQPLMDKLDSSRLPGSITTLMQTLIYYYDYTEVNRVRLKKKVEKYIYTANPWVTNLDCEKEVDEVYNKHVLLEDKCSIAHLVKDERMRRKIELNKENAIRAQRRVRKGVAGFLSAEELAKLGSDNEPEEVETYEEPEEENEIDE